VASATYNLEMNSRQDDGPPNLRVALGWRIRALRSHSGLSQEALALAAGVHRTYMGSIERGERNVTLENIARIAATLGLSVRAFFDHDLFDQQ
jgi:transcriptional regulator with XRE-family HTH domain